MLIENTKKLKKDWLVIDYENYAERIKPLFELDMKDDVRISVKKGKMTAYKIRKTKFSQLNDKRIYFPNGIVSLPFGHLSLKEVDEHKKNNGQRIEKYF